MPAKIEFSKLTPADALDLGVLMEEEARQRYIDFAELLEDVHHDREAAVFCRIIVGNEARHGKEPWRQRQERYLDAPTRVTAAMLYDVEAPGQENPSAFMTLRATMLMALDAEKKVEHQRMVREQFARSPADGPVRRDDVADEPVGQD